MVATKYFKASIFENQVVQVPNIEVMRFDHLNEVIEVNIFSSSMIWPRKNLYIEIDVYTSCCVIKIQTELQM